MFKNKKGQAEIIGFAIIVILLIFAFVFFMKVKLGEGESETRLIRNNLRANSALNALMKVNVDEDKQMKDLIKGCYSSGDEAVCGSVEDNIGHYLSELFSDGEYYLDIPEVGSFGEGCEKGISASPFVIEGHKVQFKICT